MQSGIVQTFFENTIRGSDVLKHFEVYIVHHSFSNKIERVVISDNRAVVPRLSYSIDNLFAGALTVQFSVGGFLYIGDLDRIMSEINTCNALVYQWREYRTKN